jgi:hypothetical protein
MPHIDDQELRQMEKLDEFLNGPDREHLLLKVGVAMPFRLAKASGTITLLEVGTKMYGWGGCGNNLGNGARILLESDGKKEEMEVGPQPRIFQRGGLRMALGNVEADKGMAMLVIDEV